MSNDINIDVDKDEIYLYIPYRTTPTFGYYDIEIDLNVDILTNPPSE
jgi:hypothetical protein